MKNTIMTLAAVCVLSTSTAVLAQEAAVPEPAAETALTTVETAAPETPAPAVQAQQHGAMDATWKMQKGMGMHGQHKGMQHGGQQGGGQHGKGQHGKGRHAKHEQVVKRLDVIEARLAKIEAMLEILMRR